MEKEKRISLATQLVSQYVKRTGVKNADTGNNRYLWTDALAVQALWGLFRETGLEQYREWALQLIELVHNTLGKYREDDEREGWISGLSEERGREHPTAGGLRIGKRMAEREKGETFNARLEWERDGQYYHYITRWVSALIQTNHETGEDKYGRWAAELLEVSHKFMDDSEEPRRLFWKMSTDLSRPLVDSMGAHDPLEGALLARVALSLEPQNASPLKDITRKMENLCKGRDWTTSDPLGIGGLLLNVPRSASLDQDALIEELQADRLYQSAIDGIETFNRRYDPKQPANQRLAFRECGMTLGFNVVHHLGASLSLPLDIAQEKKQLINHLEQFWSNEENRRSASWLDHLDINSVTLAASHIGQVQAEAFTV